MSSRACCRGCADWLLTRQLADFVDFADADSTGRPLAEVLNSFQHSRSGSGHGLKPLIGTMEVVKDPEQGDEAVCFEQKSGKDGFGVDAPPRREQGQGGLREGNERDCEKACCPHPTCRAGGCPGRGWGAIERPCAAKQRPWGRKSKIEAQPRFFLNSGENKPNEPKICF